jgi:hypothetical protein
MQGQDEHIDLGSIATGGSAAEISGLTNLPDGTLTPCRGCRAIAYAHSQVRGQGDYLAEDPQCFLEH